MSVNPAALVALLSVMTVILMRTLVSCQPLKPLESDTSVILSDSHQSRHRRRLNAAYDSDADDDDGVVDARWLLMGAAAAAVGLSSLITGFALCTCCPPYRTRRRRNDQSYVGQIDLEDIRVICNRAVTSPAWSTSVDGGVVVNAGALEKQHGAVLNNQRATPGKHGCEYKTAAAAAGGGDASDAAMSDVVVENGRIVLQYRNVHAGLRTTDKPDDPADTADRTRHPGHVIGAPVNLQTDLDYDMNDVVWKNLAASTK